MTTDSENERLFFEHFDRYPLDGLKYPTSIPATVRQEVHDWIDRLGLDSNSLSAGLVWLRLGDIETPHEIVQSAERGLAAYVHGMIHRIEGDYWNAKYWFRKAQHPIESELRRSFASKVKDSSFATIDSEERSLFENFSAVSLVEFCENRFGKQSNNNRSPNLTQLSSQPIELTPIDFILQHEWQTAWHAAMT